MAPRKANLETNDTQYRTLVLCFSVLFSVWYFHGFWGLPSLWVLSIATQLVRRSGLSNENKDRLKFLMFLTHTLLNLDFPFPLWYTCVPAVFIYLFYLAEDEKFRPKVQKLVLGCLTWAIVIFNWHVFGGLWAALYPVANFCLAGSITGQDWK
jgi:hypothetical protein